MSFEIIRGDNSRPMRITVTDPDAQLDAVGATVQLRCLQPNGVLVVWPLAIESATATTAVLVKNWAPGDTDLVGSYRGQVVIEKAGVIRSFPVDGSFLKWVVHKQLTGTTP